MIKGDQHNVTRNTAFGGADTSSSSAIHDRPKYQDHLSSLDNLSIPSAMIGVGRPTLDVNVRQAWMAADFWGVVSSSGKLWHNSDDQEWQGMQGYDDGDVVRLLLDSDAGTLTIKKNGALLGVAVTSGLTGDLCWAVSCDGENSDSVRIKAVDPAEF